MLCDLAHEFRLSGAGWCRDNDHLIALAISSNYRSTVEQELDRPVTYGVRPASELLVEYGLTGSSHVVAAAWAAPSPSGSMCCATEALASGMCVNGSTAGRGAQSPNVFVERMEKHAAVAFRKGMAAVAPSTTFNTTAEPDPIGVIPSTTTFTLAGSLVHQSSLPTGMSEGRGVTSRKRGAAVC